MIFGFAMPVLPVSYEQMLNVFPIATLQILKILSKNGHTLSENALASKNECSLITI
jgi:hypothetical protein